MKQFVFTILLLLFITSIGFGQISLHTQPYSFRNENLTKANPPQTEDLPGIDVSKALKEDKQTVNSNRFGVGMTTNFTLKNSGRWYSLPNGDRIWILKVKSDRAKSLNATYNRFYLPPGATLHLYNKAQTQILGAFTSINNKETGDFATSLITDDNVVFEYYEPANQQGNGIIEIDKIYYGYKGSSVEKGFGSANLPCNINVNCSPYGDSWQDEKKGVARIMIPNGNSVGWCSGSLINNTNNDGKQYFLSADHCVGAVAFSQWIFHFNYEGAITLGCSTPASEPSTNFSVTGANLKSKDSGTDFLLLEISTPIPYYYGVYYNGWDKTGNTPTSAIGIHHPVGDIKKISIDQNSPTIYTYNPTSTMAKPIITTTNGHWRVVWDDGVTEGGSSGSSLFAPSGLIIGQLHGGANHSCTNSSGNSDGYGRLSMSWAGGGTSSSRLSDWLDPISSGVSTLNSYVSPTSAVPSTCSQISSPANGATNTVNTTDLSWSLNTEAQGYKLKIGTTAGGDDFLAETDLGNTFSYQPSTFNLNTTYYVTLIAYNPLGDAVGCTSTSFTTPATPQNVNYGGGLSGTDPYQPNSGGYYFANSTLNAAASPSQPSYSWIDPVTTGHTEINTWDSGNDDTGYKIFNQNQSNNIGFSFPFWSVSNVFTVNPNGAIHFGYSTNATGENSTIPSTGVGNTNLIAGCYMDLDDESDGKVYYGGDNSTYFVVTWWHYHDKGDTDEYITFQIILYSNGTIKIQYNDAESTADDGTYTDILNDALVGITNSDGTEGIQYRNNGVGGPMFSSPLALAFSTNSAALPVEMATFTAKAEGTTNRLEWTTLSEQDNAGFEVERSANGTEFDQIGRVAGNGTTLEVSNYQFIDENPIVGTNYYRLRQINSDGSFEYSNIVEVTASPLKNSLVKIYPNPVEDYMIIENGQGIATIYNVLGQPIKTFSITNIQFSIPTIELIKGQYILQLMRNDGTIVTQRFVK